MQDFRIRYAPSPTGYLHLGNARSALFGYLLAKHYNGTFILRIEDTDIQRNAEDGVKSQIENMKWLGIDYDEGPFKERKEYAPYYQSKRLPLYKNYLDVLLEKDMVYPCFCSLERLKKLRESQMEKGHKAPMYDKKCERLTVSERDKYFKINTPHTYRFNVKKLEDISWVDKVRGKISFNSQNIEDFIIIKGNGFPTYNFANVVDDIEMNITHVVRGEEHISNTPKQILLYRALEKQHPEFGHLPIIINKKGKKLSKRDTEESQFIHQYREMGIIPEALLNYLALLGWTSGEEREIYSKEEIESKFDFPRISKAPAQYDITKLLWFSKEYLKNMPKEKIEILKERCFDGTGPKVITSDKSKPIEIFVSDCLEINEWTINDHVKVVKEVIMKVHRALELKNDSILRKRLESYLKGVSWASKKEKTISIGDLIQIEKDIKENLKKMRTELDMKPRDFFQSIREICTTEREGPEVWRVIILYKVLGLYE